MDEHTRPGAWAQTVWQILQAQEQKLVKEGKTLETDEENLAELTEKAQGVAEKQVPVLGGTGVGSFQLYCNDPFRLLSGHGSCCLILHGLSEVFDVFALFPGACH